MKTKTQQGPACYPCLARTGLFVVLASGLMFILLLRVVAAQPGVVATAPRPAVTKVECSSLSSAILGRSVSYCVALPGDYAASTARYPTLYFLHGLFENERSWSERGGEDVLDGLVSQGQVGKFLVVLPDGGKTFYINSLDGHERYEDFFIQELVPAIDRTYRTVSDRQARGISGTSMGGYGALHLSMRHADVFGTASAQSAALLPKFPNPIPTEGRWGFYARILQGPFGSPLNEAYWEANSPLTLAEHPEHFANLKLYFDCGDNDRYGFEEGAQLLDKILTEKGFRHEFTLRPGNHGWSYLSQYMKYAVLFHWQCFEQSSAAVAHTSLKQGAH
jgi:S-formylglutathione hydrolase FrmB